MASIATQPVPAHKPEEDKTRAISDDEAQADDTTFEDAVDTASVRSLTKTQSIAKKPDSEPKFVDSIPDDEPERSLHSASDKVASSDSESIDGSESSEGTQELKASVEEAKPQAETDPKTHTMTSLNLQNISLEDEPSSKEPKPEPEPEPAPPKPIEKDPPRSLSISGFANSLPSLPWSPSAPPEVPAKSPTTVSDILAASTNDHVSLPTTAGAAQPVPAAPAPTPAPAPSRKLTSPFSWLSRNSMSKEKDVNPSPPQTSPRRRNTASSVATLGSNPELMLGRLEEESSGTDGTNGNIQDNLRDRFKMARLKEESTNPDNDSNAPATPGLNEDKATPLETSEQSETTLPTPLSASFSPQVDWDLWQSVVYEGPTAVARTSSEELNKAIASGIPSAIRGVVWQVLAQSKSQSLEVMYRGLVVRGTDKDKDRNSSGTTGANLSVQVDTQLASSASSIRSDISATNGLASPSINGEKAIETPFKPQGLSPAERQRKEREEAAMLQKLEKTIRRDMGSRTSFSKYAAAEGLQEGLFGVCKAYALYDEAVGYAQGMNFLVMPLLFNMPEDEAFCLLVRLMNHYQLRDLFVQDMPGLHMRLYQFERLLEDLEPALYCHLHRRSISPHLYATQWFLTLFAYRFPLQLVLRIYDLILSEGLSAILRFGIVLMQKNADALLAMNDMQQLTTFLKDKVFDVYIDKAPSAGSILENGFFGSSSSSMDKEVYRADQLVQDACQVKLTPETLKLYTTEWEEKTRTEKERETEVQDLRSSNSNLTLRLRKLEERLQAVDGEQASLATELVHTKVENEELKDQNESLAGQVRELKIVIEKQPIEIEQAWKLERDDLLKRNEKVHEDHQKIEKEMVELEEELVQTKLRWAELNAQHEVLTRRWTDMKKQFA